MVLLPDIRFFREQNRTVFHAYPVLTNLASMAHSERTIEMEKLMDYDETAEYLGLAKGTLYSLVCRKQIPHRRFSGRLVRFDPNELKEWVDSRAVADSRMQEGDK